MEGDDESGIRLSDTAQHILDNIRGGKHKSTSRNDAGNSQRAGAEGLGNGRSSRADGEYAQRSSRVEQRRSRRYESDDGDSADIPWSSGRNDKQTPGVGSSSDPDAYARPESERPSGLIDYSIASESARERRRREFWNPAIPNVKFTLPSANKLNAAEARTFREPLFNALGEFFESLDKVMSSTNKNGAQADCWGTMSDKEVYTITDACLALAQRSGQAAQAVRGIVSIAKYFEIGMILGPRFVATVQFYALNGGFGFPMLMGPMPSY